MTEWQQLCAGAKGIMVDDAVVTVDLGRERQHRIEVCDAEGSIELRGIVARRAEVASIENTALKAWSRNRASTLVGFRIDERGRLVGESWVPRAGLTRDEFLLYVRSIAAACDLFEFQVTGRDRE